MTSRRVLKAAEAIREVVSMAILTEIKDPRVQHVTVTSVEVTPDMRQAKVNVSIMGSDAKQRLALHGLQSAAGFLQSKVASRIDTRYTPRLEFALDLGVKKSIEIAAILDRVLPPRGSDPGRALDDAGDLALEDDETGDDETGDDESSDGESSDDDASDDERLDDEARNDSELEDGKLEDGELEDGARRQPADPTDEPTGETSR